MNRIHFVFFLVLLATPGDAFSDATKKCYEKAASQIEMNQCAGKSLEDADKELNRVYNKIKEVYKEDRAFLEKLTNAQLAWKKLRDADFELKFPHVDEPNFYGSVFSMCGAEYNTQLTLKRVQFLKQWLTGSAGGDMCRGSQVPQSYLQGLLGDEYNR